MENNTMMLQEMHVLVPKFCGTCVRICCFAHILNLVIKCILLQFGKGAAVAVNQGDKEGNNNNNNKEDVEAANEVDNTVIESINNDDTNIKVTPEDNALASSGITKPFLFATKEISMSGCALIYQVIPYIDVLTHHLDTFTANKDLTPAVHATTYCGRLILDKYYDLTDGSIVYRIAMKWITATVELTHDKWTTYYKPMPMPTPAADAPAAHPNVPAVNASASCNGSGQHSTCHSWYPSTPALFVSISGCNKAVLDELEAYLEAPPLSTMEDLLAYWNIVLKMSPSFLLTTMAINFLTMQATSTDSECLFSSGHLIISRLQHSLSKESVRTRTVLGSWCNYPEIVLDAQLVELITGHGGAHAAAPVAVPPAAVPVAAPEVIKLD
ncbi:hypothetical protein VTO73DRAFT_6430 [Trametes versicolor]